jgi:ABC-2 type transport system ATP-binding protein
MIEARALTRRFGEFVAVDAISLSIPNGAILALLGPNGAGKTTTVRMLAGLLAPTSGSAMVSGIDVASRPGDVRARSGLVTDTPGLYERMAPRPYLDFFGSLYGLEERERAARIDELLAAFDLQAHGGEPIAGFSKGMKQKVALARALLHQPVALFLDEPTSGLDPQAAHAVRELIVRLKRSNRSIVLCTHDLDEAERLADQVAILQHGRVIACGSPDALRKTGAPETVVRVEFAEPDPGAAAAIGQLEGVFGVHADGALRLEYRAANTREVNPRVLARLVERGSQVVSMTCETSTLEDVYFRAMGDLPRQEEAA